MPYKDPEKARERSKRYCSEHKEEKKAYDKEYYKKNKDKINEKRKLSGNYSNNKYKANHREEVNAKNNDYMKDRNAVSRLTATSHRKLWTPEEDEIIIKLYSRGTSQTEIANRLGRTIGSVNIHLVKLRKSGKIS